MIRKKISKNIFFLEIAYFVGFAIISFCHIFFFAIKDLFKQFNINKFISFIFLYSFYSYGNNINSSR